MGRRRWIILAVGAFAQAAGCAFVYGMPMLLPAFRDRGLSLVDATILIDAPVAGLMMTLYLWGHAADRNGERRVILSGVAAAAALLVAASLAGPLWLVGVLLVLAGASSASAFAASGRLVMGWFPARERGLAMGIRQTAQPVGVALAALILPPLAHGVGIGAGLLALAGISAVAALLVYLFAANPPRTSAAPAPLGASPYRGARVLQRVHAASSLLVVPQFTVAVFTLIYLVEVRHWHPVVAGWLVFGFQLGGALARVGSGVWSDRVGSRLGPMRTLAVAAAVLMGLLAVAAFTHAWWIVLVFGASAVVTVADNGLAYTAVAELAGRDWSGRALGLHNTVQNATAVATPPLLALVVGIGGYGWAFAASMVAPMIAIAMTPVEAERRAHERAVAARA